MKRRVEKKYCPEIIDLSNPVRPRISSSSCPPYPVPIIYPTEAILSTPPSPSHVRRCYRHRPIGPPPPVRRPRRLSIGRCRVPLVPPDPREAQRRDAGREGGPEGEERSHAGRPQRPPGQGTGAGGGRECVSTPPKNERRASNPSQPTPLRPLPSPPPCPCRKIKT